MKHTPGPWEYGRIVDNRKSNKNKGTGWYVNATNEKLWYPRICDTPVQTWEGQQEANARLIAAAPDLLEVAKKLLEAQNMPDDEYNYGEFIYTVHEAIKIARRAIAKAEGRL